VAALLSDFTETAVAVPSSAGEWAPIARLREGCVSGGGGGSWDRFACRAAARGDGAPLRSGELICSPSMSSVRS